MNNFGKYIFENAESCIIVITLFVAIFSFFYKQAQIEPQVIRLREDFENFILSSSRKHEVLATDQQLSKHSLELSLAKVETSLAQITTDIQFIKQKIIYKESSK